MRSPSLVCLLALAAAPGSAQDAPHASGFATLGAGTSAAGALDRPDPVARLQIGADWTSTSPLSAHVHLVARTDSLGARRGRVGVAEAYLEANLHAAGRVRLRAGSFFLPTSFENVDALWENPYAIASSALNTWWGEELRPVGLDAAYYARGLALGATVFRGNETLGALPPVRGWAIGDRWTLLGEELPVDDAVFTSVSAENDGRLGWSARLGWIGARLALQYTYLDNRADGLLYGDLRNWGTRSQVVGIGYAAGAWTVAAENGWGPTFIAVPGRRIVSDIRAGYLLVSRRLGSHRGTVRIESWDDGEESDTALTLAYAVVPLRAWRASVEITLDGSDARLLAQLRYGFSIR
jgi:hypothetical protein